MLPASTRGIGMALGFPDVCLTPSPAGPVPIPYPNIAEHSQASKTVATIKINMMDALNMMSEIPMSSGDEAGSSHPTVKGPQRYTMGMFNILLNLMPAITLACLTSHNNMNCPVGAVLVPSAPNILFNFATGCAGASLEPASHYADAAAADGLIATSDTLRVEVFSMGFAVELDEAVRRAVASGASVVTLDLRGCPGGVLSSAIDAAELFLPAGALIVTLVDEDGDALERRSRGGPLLDVPLVLLVDEDTASAAETFASALAAHGRALVLGDATRGKRSAARPISLGDGTASVAASFECVPPSADAAG
ncbi:MAG: PAAR-like domain-containing protein [Polyangiaceae bacterium]